MLPRSSLLLPLVASFTLLVGTAAAQAADAQATWAALAQPTLSRVKQTDEGYELVGEIVKSLGMTPK